jgi:hemoglobin/transferrin/lactoferrin receptor protein
MFKPHCSSACALAIGRLRPLALSVSLAISAGAFPTLGYANESRSFQVQSGTLDQAITAFGQQSGVLVSVSGNVSLNKQTAGLVGEYTPFGGLTELLKGTGLRAIPNHDGSFTIAAPQSAETSSNDIALDPLTIVDDGYTPTRDEQGANAVYDKNQSTSFIGKAEVERYKGTAASDLLQGVTGVFSGEARNSGALDVNIRGIQGTGRVPVAIDGTEQALTVWRGYNGATNRNYIDPNLIGNIQIYKGAGVVRDVNTSTGGAMVVNTLNADDIIKPGEDFGIEVKVEGSSNSVSERIPSLHTGEDYREVDGYPSVPTAAISDETLIIRPDSNSGSYNVFSGEDYVVIHELAHLSVFNHSPAFWQRVAQFCPDYDVWRRYFNERGSWLSWKA